MREEFLHYIWKYKLFKNQDLKTQNQEKLEVINQGIHNSDAGPDFFNARIKINDTIWVGNVEIHINSSDWYKHNHHLDKAYDNVILQVVLNNDKDVFRTNGQLIPTLAIEFDNEFLNNYESLIKNESWISCQSDIHRVDSFTIHNWIEKLAIERLEEKSERIHKLLEQTNSSWENAFYIQLASNFGFKLNSTPFELLAKSLPLTYLAKHKDNLFQIEALLFGQAGFLEDKSGDEYFKNLKKEYIYLQKKFMLTPIEKHLWKFLRSRPGNFPTIRIAQYSKLIYSSTSLFSKILEAKTIQDLYTLFIVNPSDYWESHYVFNKESVKKSKSIGKSAVDIILINTIIPFLFIYGDAKGQSELKTKAIELLEKLKSEKNAIITKWDELGVESENAFHSQALIQLKNEYCNHKKCLNCQIGNYIIRNNK
ncbi:MAG: DUF2851 family protein [Bacteroidales bacterium]|nr:DUF2851 family protein [Bacteroidales bacterium]